MAPPAAAVPSRDRSAQAPHVQPASLVFEGIGHRFGETDALLDVSFPVAPGEVVGLLGHSGCGKTTLLRIASGVERPSAGRVLLNGQEVAGPSGFVPPERRGVGLMFQDYALFPHLSVLENVCFGLRAMSADKARATARAALEAVGLGAFGRDYPHMLSGGEQQRVALARALAPRPGILLMDEPFSNLDRRMRDAVRDETIDLVRQSGASAMLVTHDPEEALRVADRIVLMHGGRVLQIGDGEALYRRPESLFAARFFCDLNEYEGRVTAGAVRTPFGAHAAQAFEEGASVRVCIRPEDVRVTPAASLSGELPGTVEGRLLSRRFLGESDLWQIEIEGLSGRLAARVPGAQRFAVECGETLAVSVTEILVFAFSAA